MGKPGAKKHPGSAPRSAKSGAHVEPTSTRPPASRTQKRASAGRGATATMLGALKDIASALQTIDKRMGSLDDRMTKIEGRMATFEGRLGQIEPRTLGLEDVARVLHARVVALEGSSPPRGEGRPAVSPRSSGDPASAPVEGPAEAAEAEKSMEARIAAAARKIAQDMLDDSWESQVARSRIPGGFRRTTAFHGNNIIGPVRLRRNQEDYRKDE